MIDTSTAHTAIAVILAISGVATATLVPWTDRRKGIRPGLNQLVSILAVTVLLVAAVLVLAFGSDFIGWALSA